MSPPGAPGCGQVTLLERAIIRIATQEQLLVNGPGAARILGISPRSLRVIVARGDLEKVILSSRIVRYRVEDLRAMAAPHPAAWPPRLTAREGG